MKKVNFVLIILACFVFITFAFSTNAVAKVEGLVVYLSFDDGSDKVIKDLSGAGHNGENHGAKAVDGKFGKALQFGGVDTWVTIGDAPDLNFGAKDSLTAMVWAKIVGAPSGQGNLLAKYAVGAGTTPFYGMFHNVNNQVHAYLRDGASKLTEQWSKTAINDDKWHHIALVRDTSKKKAYVYVDGVQESEKDDLAEDLTNAFPLAIGRHTGEFLVGIVDEAMLFRRALSENEIKTAMTPKNLLAVSSNGRLATKWGEIKQD
ncbi:MAG: LamG domain-containing protein [Candidatus Poribacteria bacterium]